MFIKFTENPETWVNTDQVTRFVYIPGKRLTIVLADGGNSLSQSGKQADETFRLFGGAAPAATKPSPATEPEMSVPEPSDAPTIKAGDKVSTSAGPGVAMPSATASATTNVSVKPKK